MEDENPHLLWLAWCHEVVQRKQGGGTPLERTHPLMWSELHIVLQRSAHVLVLDAKRIEHLVLVFDEAIICYSMTLRIESEHRCIAHSTIATR